MSNLLFANNAQTTLAAGITNVATTASLSPGSGVLFPAPTGTQYFMLTLIDAATGLLNEIVKVTNVTGDVITMVRAQEGTTAKAWLAGDNAANLWTAGSGRAMAQNTDLQNQAYAYSLDTGTVNHYIGAYTPAVTTLVDGMVLRIKAAHLNSGPSDFTPNSGTIAPYNIVGNGNAALGGGEIIANGDIWLQWNTSVGSPGSWCMVATAVAYALVNGSAGQPFAASALTAATVSSTTGTILNAASTAFGLRVGVGVDLAGTTGQGFEFSTNTSTSLSTMTSYNRSSAGYANLLLDALSIALNISGVAAFTIASTGAATISKTNSSQLTLNSSNSNGATLVISEGGVAKALVGHISGVTGLEFSGNGSTSHMNLTTAGNLTVTGTASAAIATATGQLAAWQQVIGLGSTWQAATYNSGTAYANSLSSSMCIMLNATVGVPANTTITVNGITFDVLTVCAPVSTGGKASGFVIIPPGATFTFTDTGTVTRTSYKLSP